jgi:hypothetical protein
MAPILNSTTGMIPQIMESPELIELLRCLNALEPLSEIATTTTTLSSSPHLSDNNKSAPTDEHFSLLVLVRRLTELLHPYQEHWSFEEMVRSLMWLSLFLSNESSMLARLKRLDLLLCVVMSHLVCNISLIT